MTCPDHQTTTAVSTLPTDPFSAAEQLAYLKRGQILRKKDLYARSMQKLDLIYNSKTIQQQILDTFFVHSLSILQIPEADLDHISVQPLTKPLAPSLFSSASLFCTSVINMLKLFLVGEGGKLSA